MLFLTSACPPVARAQQSHVSYTNITTQTTTVIKGTAAVPAAGVLHSVCFNNPVATSVVTLFDNTAASGTKIGTITVPTSPQPVCLRYDVNFQAGLTVQTATASSDLTISWE